MLAGYFPILLFVIIGLALGAILLAAGALLGAHKPYGDKVAPYECGFSEFDNARLPFDVRFYLVAILFIIFDLETAFLFPWALSFRTIGWFGFFSMVAFLGLLVIGFIYEWKKGALEWE